MFAPILQDNNRVSSIYTIRKITMGITTKDVISTPLSSSIKTIVVATFTLKEQQ